MSESEMGAGADVGGCHQVSPLTPPRPRVLLDRFAIKILNFGTTETFSLPTEYAASRPTECPLSRNLSLIVT